MVIVCRAFVCILVFVAAFLFSYWLLFVQIFSIDLPDLASVAALLTATVLAGLVWKATDGEAKGVLATSLTWAGAVGALEFSGGFSGR